MCVILVCDTDRPSEAAVRAAYETNPAGAGIAWQDGKGKVKWKKGLKEAEILELVRTVPFPFVAHFRIPTCGGDLPGLTHPFSIEPSASTALEGETEGQVLFHNGHWGGWKNVSLETSVRGSLKLPEGRLSDSRMMAWCASIYGSSFLELIEEKIVTLGPTGEPEIYGSYTNQGHGWSVFENMLVSNRNFVSKIHKFEVSAYSASTVINREDRHEASKPYLALTPHKPYVRPYGNQWADDDPVVEVFLEGKPPSAPPSPTPTIMGPTKAATGGAADPATFRGSSQAAKTGEAQQQEVQAGQVGLYPGAADHADRPDAQGSQGRSPEGRATGREGEGGITPLRSLVTGEFLNIPFIPPPSNEEAIDWVRSLNPPTKWGSGDTERSKRLAMAAAGISPVL